MRYQVKVVRSNGDIVTLTLDAGSEHDARAQVGGDGSAVLSVKEEFGGRFIPSLFRSKFSLLLFTQDMLAMLDAGLTLIEALEAISEKEGGSETGDLLGRIISQLYEGKTLSVALADYPKHFPSLFVVTIRASERTGDIAEALKRYVVYQKQMEAVRGKLISASIYPLLLMIVGGMVILFLMFYVVPKFSHIYEDMGKDLPLMSQLLMAWGIFLEQNRIQVMLAFSAIGAAMFYAASREYIRSKIVARLWRIPAIGDRVKTYQLARFYRTLGMLLVGGMPISRALDMVPGLLHESMRTRLLQATKEIREGKSISESMDKNDLTTPVALRMLRIGEKTGQMGEMMERIASFCDDEVSRWVDMFIRLFEPLLMIFIGMVIGVIIVMMYFPIFELAGNIQ